jgi:ribonuclease HI
MAKYRCYVVYKGKVPGVYDEWSECQAQVEGVSGASHKGFKSRQEAEASYVRRLTLARERAHNRRLMYYIVSLSLIVIALLAYIIV